MSELVEIYGPELIIDHCVIGRNLNLWEIRGYARLDQLAAVSAPDVFDKYLNPHGTQRDLKPKHAKQAFNYASEATTLIADAEPRAFTEIILNARDKSVISIVPYDDNAPQELDFSSTDVDVHGGPVSLRINVRQIAWPRQDQDPQISRVDGNHRLSEVPLAYELDEDLPVVPFALFVGLTADQERALFRDINGNQEKMETSHLASIMLHLQGVELLTTESGRALWLAQQLSTQHNAFEGKVFFGGAKKGAKESLGSVPPLKISTLRQAIAQTIRDADRLKARYFPEGQDPNEKDGRAVLLLLNRYWTAVSNAYPEAWQNRKDFVLLQAIGLTAFSKLAANVIELQYFEKGAIEQSDFDTVLKHVANEVALNKDQFTGIAGMAGARVVYDRLVAALNSGGVQATIADIAVSAAINANPSPLDELPNEDSAMSEDPDDETDF
jgi:DGQHR domain-containing protein